MSARHAAVGGSAVATWAERGTDGTIDLGGNELPAAFGLSLHALEAYVHGWDLAQGLGRAFDPSPELTEQTWQIAQQIVSDDFRGDPFGSPYGTAVDVAGDASLADRLIAFTGRDPRQPIGP